jgi:hypothetical protein
MSSIALSNATRPTQSDLSAGLSRLQKSVANDIASGKLSGDTAKAATNQVKALDDSFKALSSTGSLRLSDITALTQRVAGASKVLAQSAANAPAASTSAAATTAATAKKQEATAPATQADVQKAARELRQNLASGIANGTLQGDAATAATRQVQSLSNTLQAQSTKGPLSAAQIANFGTQISAANAQVAPAANTTSTNTSTPPATGTSTQVSTTSSGTITATTTAADKTAGAQTSTTPALASAQSARYQAQVKALETLTQISNAGFSNALGPTASTSATSSNAASSGATGTNQKSLVNLFA